MELPSVPRRLVTTEAAPSSVTPADASAPYTMLSKALGEFSEGVDNLGVTVAQDQAHSAVTRDQDGNLQVSLMPVMTGKIGDAFNRVAKHSYAIQLEQEARTKIEEARLKNDGNPQAFNEWATTYVDSVSQQQPDAALRETVKLSLGRLTGQTYDSMLVQRHNIDLKRANETIDSKLTGLGDDLEILARKGGVNAPDFAGRLQDFNTLLDEKVKNPLLAFPQEKADLFREAVLTRAYGAAILDRVDGIYRTEGFDAARQHLNDAVDQLGVKLKSGDAIRRQGLSWLRSEEAGFRGERDAIGREWSAARPQADSLPRDTLIDLQERARSVGNMRVENDIAVRIAALDTVSALRGLPATDRAAIATTGKINLPLVDRIAGAEGTAKAATSSAEGTGQFVRGTWLDLMQRHHPELTAGKSEAEILALRKDRDLGREMIGRYAEDNGRALQSAGLPVNDATLYLSHFLGAGDAVKVLKADPSANLAGVVDPASLAANKSVFDKTPTAGALLAWAGRKVGVGEADLTQSREGLVALGMLKKELGKDTAQRITDLKAAVGREELPDAGEVVALQTLVHAVGTPDQQREVATLGAMAEVGAKFKTLSAPQRAAVVSAWLEKGKAGAPQAERNLAAALAKANTSIDAAYKDDRYGASYRYAEGVRALPPADFSKPDDLKGLLQAKVAQQNTINADQGLSPGSVFRPAEADALKTALTQGDGAAAGVILGQLTQLPPEYYKATMADKPVRDALDGMVRSYDPVKLNVAMTTLDQLYRADAVGFSHTFGADTFRRLQTWQARRDSMTPQQMAEHFQRADDPAAQAGRKALAEEADDKMKKLGASDVATAFGSSYGFTPGVIARNVTGSDPAPPTDPLQAATLTAEFKSLVRERYVDTGDMGVAQKQAAERMKTIWGPSEVNGNSLMRYPPDRYYPAVDGSHAWMTRDVETSIEKQIGKPRYSVDTKGSGVIQRGQTGAPDLFPAANWSYKLLSDPQTEADVKTGRPPSYVVQVVEADGRINIPTGGDGRPLRYRFDAAPAQEQARATFSGRREDIDRRQAEAGANVRAMQAPMQRLGGQ